MTLHVSSEVSTCLSEMSESGVVLPLLAVAGKEQGEGQLPSCSLKNYVLDSNALSPAPPHGP